MFKSENCVTSSQIQSVQGSQLTGTIPVAKVPAGSGNYIQNTTSQQAASDFNISGNGTVGGILSGDVVSATTHYVINGARILSTGTGAFNLLAGENAGRDNTTGGSNSYFGRAAGMFNTSGANNSFFGHLAGQVNFGNFNSAFGYSAGTHSDGDELTIIGALADVNLSQSITNATAIGARATVDQSDSLVLGSISGVNGATADTKVGIGTTAPRTLLTIGQPEATVVTGRVGIFSTSGLNLVLRETTNDVEGILGVNSSSGVIYGSMTNHAVRVRTNNINRITIASDGNVGIGTTAPDQLLTVNGGASKPGGGSWAVFSDLRLKSVRGSFNAWLNEVVRLTKQANPDLKSPEGYLPQPSNYRKATSEQLWLLTE